MNPLDRIAQLTERAENAEKQADMALSNCESAQREVALLRSQLADARQQLERDSATIAKLAKDKRELLRMVSLCASEFASLAPHLGNVCGTWESTQEKAETALLKFGPVDAETVNEYLSRHA